MKQKKSIFNFFVNRNGKKLTDSRKRAKILADNSKGHHPIETLDWDFISCLLPCVLYCMEGEFKQIIMKLQQLIAEGVSLTFTQYFLQILGSYFYPIHTVVLSQSLGYQCDKATSFSHSVVYSICTIFIISTVPHHLTVNIFFCYIFTIDDNRKMAENLIFSNR